MPVDFNFSIFRQPLAVSVDHEVAVCSSQLGNEPGLRADRIRDKASALLTKLYGKEIVAKEDMSLADIYYYEEDSYEEGPTAKIGFDME